MLPADVYHITREKGTEAPFTGIYHAYKEQGMYHCSNCGAELFSSDSKYDSGTGWPSFVSPVDKTAVDMAPDTSQGMTRTEVTCARCGAHLGHVFDDGPRQQGKDEASEQSGKMGKRFCVNSASLSFKKTEKKS